MLSIKKITLIGAGRVGWHLGHRLAECGFKISQVYSRDAEKAARLASKIGAKPTGQLAEISPDADLFLIAVKDEAILETARKLAENRLNGIVAHTSGATAREILNPFFEKNGVVWPLQSISFEKTPDWKNLPIILEAGDETSLNALKTWAEKCTQPVFCKSGDERAKLHLAATVVNNFSNHLYTLAFKFLGNNQSDFDALRPLILETAIKIQNNYPQKMQTGAAVRNDKSTIEKHLFLLKNEPGLYKIYELLTESILNNRL